MWVQVPPGFPGAHAPLSSFRPGVAPAPGSILLRGFSILRKDWNSFLSTLHKQSLSPFESMDDLADWFLEEPSRLSLFGDRVTYREFAKELGFSEAQWDVARGLKSSPELAKTINERQFGLVVNPLTYRQHLEATIKGGLDEETRQDHRLATQKYLDQQYAMLKPTKIAVENKHSFEVVVKSEGSVSPMFRVARDSEEVVDVPYTDTPQLDAKFASTSSFVLREAVNEATRP